MNVYILWDNKMYCVECKQVASDRPQYKRVQLLKGIPTSEYYIPGRSFYLTSQAQLTKKKVIDAQKRGLTQDINNFMDEIQERIKSLENIKALELLEPIKV